MITRRKERSRPAILLMVVASLACTMPSLVDSAFARSPKEIAAEVMPSVVLLVMADAHHKPTSLGSGFVVRPGIVATNYHVIQDASFGVAKMSSSDNVYPIAGVLASSPELDIALLSIPTLQAPPLAIGDIGTMSVGDQVFAIGSPRGLEATFSNGIISAFRKIGKEDLIQITAPISPGSSGGPVVNDDGQVIGVATEYLARGQNLNFAVSSANISQMLGQIGAPTPLVDMAALQRPAEGTTIQPPSSDDDEGGIEITNIVVPTSCSVAYNPISFTAINRYTRPVRWLNFVAVFYDRNRSPIDTVDLIQAVAMPGEVLAPGAGKRVNIHGAFVSEEVCKLAGLDSIEPRMELKLTDFRFADQRNAESNP